MRQKSEAYRAADQRSVMVPCRSSALVNERYAFADLHFQQTQNLGVRVQMLMFVVGRVLDGLWRARWFVLAALAAALVLAIATSLGDAMAFAGFDLRPKVLGARALLLGLDPYVVATLRWTSATPPELADPQTVFYAGKDLSRVTYPPSLLLLYMPFATLPYKVQRLLWWGMEWAAMLAAICVLCAATPRRFRLAFLVAAIGAFACSYFWRWHAERGQYYVFVVLLLSLDLLALRAAVLRPRAWLGAPTGVALAFRPTIAVVVPLLWIMGERRAAVTAILTAATVMIATLPFAGAQEWEHYFDNAATMARQQMVGGKEFFSVSLPPPAGASFLIEGYDFHPGQELQLVGRNAAIAGLVRQPWALRLSVALALLLSVGAVVAMLWLQAQRAPRELRLLLFVSLPVLLDYTVPMRWLYVDVAFLPVLAVLLPAAIRRADPWALGSLSAALLASVYEGMTVSMLRTPLFLVAIALSAMALCRSGRRSAPMLFLTRTSRRPTPEG